MSNTDAQLLEFAVELVLRAGRLAAEHFFAQTPTRLKSDGSEVTDADLAVEELIRAELARHCPTDAVLGEEAGETPGSSGRRWVTDPISGTAYFSRRMPMFANLLAYEDEHGPAIGVIGLPIQDEVIFAGRGLGCFRLASGRRERVWIPDPTRPGRALMLGSNQHAWSDELLLALHRTVNLVGAVHHGVTHLVCGRVDAVLLSHQGYDDLAPLPVILTEAGGRITDVTGAPVLDGDGTALAAGPALHARLIDLLTGVPTGRGPKSL